MAEFVNDPFAGTDGTLLQDYSADWIRHPGATQDAQIANNRARGSGAGEALYYHTGTPAGADYSVFADIYVASYLSVYAAGVIGRMDSAAVTGYMARYYAASNVWQLFKIVGDTFTQLGSTVSDSLSDGETVQIELRMAGTTIELYKRGEATPAISVIDSAISDAGLAGFRLGFTGSNAPSDTAGYHLDNFRAAETGGETHFLLLMGCGT